MLQRVDGRERARRMYGRCVNSWLLGAAVAWATLPIPVSAAVAPMPPALEIGSVHQTVRERAERLAEAASGRFSTLMEEPRETAGVASAAGERGFISAVTDWLERAARDHQGQVIDKLSVSTAAAAGDGAGTGQVSIGGWVAGAMRSAFGWMQGWVSAGDGKLERVAISGSSAEAADELKEAQRLAEAREKAAEEKRRAEADEARRKEEAELKAREEARKAEAARKHEEYQRRIDEALKNLEEAQKAAGEKRRTEADEARRKEESELKAREEARKAEAARKHEEYQRRIDEALKKLEEVQKAAEEKRAKEDEAKKAAGKSATVKGEKAAVPPPVRANVLPELRLPSAREKASGGSAPSAPSTETDKSSAAGPSTAANESPATAEPKASESAASGARPNAERIQSAAPRAKPVKAQRRTREAKRARQKARLVYVVKPGDTLSGIAKRYLGSRNRYDVIYRANRRKIKNPNVIQAYQRIIVPLRKA